MRINLVTGLLAITAIIVLLFVVPLSATSQSTASNITVSDADARFDSSMTLNPSLETAIRHPKVVSATGADSIRTVSLDMSPLEARPAIKTNARIQVQGADDVQLLGFTNPFVGENPLPQSPTEIPAPEPTSTPVPPASQTPLPAATDVPLPAETPLPAATDTQPIAETPLPAASQTPIPPPIDTPLPEQQPTQAPTHTPIIASELSEESSAWDGFYAAIVGGFATIAAAIIGLIATIIAAIMAYRSTRGQNP